MTFSRRINLLLKPSEATASKRKLQAFAILETCKQIKVLLRFKMIGAYTRTDNAENDVKDYS